MDESLITIQPSTFDDEYSAVAVEQVQQDELANGQFSKSRSTQPELRAKPQSKRDNEMIVHRTGLQNGQFSKNRSTQPELRAKPQSTRDNEMIVHRTKLRNDQFSKLYHPYQPREDAIVANSRTNCTAQPSESPEYILYGSTFDSETISHLPTKPKTVWPDSRNLLMSSEAPNPNRISKNTDKISNVDNSRGKYLLSLAQNYKNL